VSELPSTGTRYDVVCPHCKKKFSAELLAGDTARHRGFKCPHCRLFVPFERADGNGSPAGAS
jgi:transposase-like protein